MITLPSGQNIGPGEPPFIIAEIGSNWSSLDDCLSSISQAAMCGADAVKFQAYDRKSLYGIDEPPIETRPGAIIEITVGRSTTVAGVLPLEWLPYLAEKAKACGIEFLCSAFSPELIDAVDGYVNIHKVASAEMTHVRMLEKLRAIGKPVILSTAAKGETDIQRALDVLGETPVVIMYCVGSYPAQEIELDHLPYLRSRFSAQVGYSDHSTDVLTIPVQACHWGQAVVLEKHVNFVNAEGPDAPHSLSAEQFKRMVDRIRHRPGRPFGPSPEESGFVFRHNRRLIATRDIQPGEVIMEGENFGIYRSLIDDTRALSPWLIDRVNGATALTTIKAGEGIAPDAIA